MITETIFFNDVWIDVEYDYSSPDRAAGWGGSITLEQVGVSGVNITNLIGNDMREGIENFLFDLKTHPYV